MTDLEKKFHQAMLDIYEIAKCECNYNATYFLRMVVDYGGLQAARRLLATDKPSDGFTALWMCRRLDLSVEAVVLKPEFVPLFTDAEREIARNRLAEYGYRLDV
jgi:hypothetical protein